MILSSLNIHQDTIIATLKFSSSGSKLKDIYLPVNLNFGWWKMFNHYFAVALKLFFLLTPFFVLTMYLTMTAGMELKQQRTIAVKVTFVNVLVCYVIYFFGEYFFSVFGITLNAFRIAAGLILFISAIELINGQIKVPEADNLSDITVVPLSIPITIGPGTIGALLLMGTDSKGFVIKIVECLGIFTGAVVVGAMLYFGGNIERLMGRRNIKIMSKLTGLVLATMAMQMVLTGVINFLDLQNIVQEALSKAAQQ